MNIVLEKLSKRRLGLDEILERLARARERTGMPERHQMYRVLAGKKNAGILDDYVAREQAKSKALRPDAKTQPVWSRRERMVREAGEWRRGSGKFRRKGEKSSWRS